jgi:ABC-2 type transport system permease protein
VLVLPFFLAQLPYEWSLDVATVMPGSGALFLIFGEGPSEDMTTTSARLTLAAWAVGALLAGGWRLLRSDANG